MNEFKPSQGPTVGTSLAKTPTGIWVLVCDMVGRELRIGVVHVAGLPRHLNYLSLCPAI